MMKNRNAEILKRRTKDFSIRVIQLQKRMPGSEEAHVIRKQIIRSSTSVAANYRAACRTKTQENFAYKTSIVEEEADETLFWLELISELQLIPAADLVVLMDEASQLTAIFSAIAKTCRTKPGRYK